jgi:CPA2 family monovalent cation:H+ antiporter-2
MGIAADFVLIVLAGLLGGLAARALRLPLLVGYVCAGILVGPHTAGPTVVQVHDVEQLAEIGVALLLFSLGLEMSFRDLAPVRRVALVGTPLQIIVTIAAAAALCVWALAMPWSESIWFGAMVSLSSSVVVLKTLAAAGLTTTLASRVMIGILVVQDLAVVPLLIILPELSDPSHLAWNLTKSVGFAALFLGAVVLLGTRLLPRLLRRTLVWGSRELFLVAVVSIGVGVGYATQRAGLSYALGAFVAGIILSESEFSHQALSDVGPLRDVFGLLFFVSVGMLLDPAYALVHPVRVAGAVALTLTGKAVILGGLARAFGYVNMAPWIVGLGLAQIGEFSFVLARIGISLKMISTETYDLALTSTVLTMALAPLVSALALPMGRAWRAWRKPAGPHHHSADAPPTGLTDHIIVAGYGRCGQAAARVLRAASIPLVIVELDYARYRDAHEAGLASLWGDMASDDVLRAAGVERARQMLLTAPDQSSARLAIARARQENKEGWVALKERRAAAEKKT